MKVAVLGPGGVGGLVAGALDRAGVQVVVVARHSTAERISKHGLHVSSVLLGNFVAHPRAVTRLEHDEEVDVLIVASKAGDLREAIALVGDAPRLILPLLNGLDHIQVLRERFDDATVVASTIRVESDRPEPGVVVHTSQFLRIDMASRYPSARAPMEQLASTLSEAGVHARVYPSTASTGDSSPTGDSSSIDDSRYTDDSPHTGDSRAPTADRSEAQVMWSKLVRLNALACTTSAYDCLLGEIRDTPALRADLLGAIDEGCAVACAEGASIPSDDPLGELTAAHATLGSSMQRDIAAGRPPELDAIPGAVLRAAARHSIACPTIERLVEMILTRVAEQSPAVDAS